MKVPTSVELTRSRQIVLLPLGSWEQHGPHLPLHTDTLIVDAVVNEALQDPSIQIADFLVAPTISITASDEHDGFLGGLSCGTQGLVASVVAIARSASWARGICIVNGHGGNFSALTQISSALDYEKIPAHVWSLPGYVGGDMHAGHTETSLLLHIAPSVVRHELIEIGATNITPQDIEIMKTTGVKNVSPNGVLGDPSQANAQHGREVLSLYCKSLVQALALCVTKWPMPTQ